MAAAAPAGFLWWVTRRTIRPADRCGGLLLILTGGVLVAPFCHPSLVWFGLLTAGLPVVLTAWTAGLIVARATGVAWHRAGAVAVVALAWAFFTLIRIDGTNAELKADVRWRWQPTAEEVFLAAKPPAAESADNSLTAPDSPLALVPGDWPEFRGVGRDGVIRGVRMPTDWEANPPRLLWRQRVGPAWSSVIVVGGRLFTQEQRGDREAVVCYDAATGKQIWVHEDAARFWETVSGAGPRATPTFADGRLFTLGATGTLNCLDAATGKRHWARNIAADAGARVPGWGLSGSPLVLDGRVIVFAGGDAKGLLAYQAASGAPAWSAPAGATSYSSPQPATLAGKGQCLMLTDHGLTSVDPATGAVLWKAGVAWPGAPRVVQPRVVGPTQLLVGTLEGMGLSLIDVTPEGDGWKIATRWSSRDMKPEFPDFVVYQGHAYGFDTSLFCCVDLATGKHAWKAGRYGRGQVMLLEEQALLLVISERGELVLLRANPQRHEELARFPALDGKTWNHPVVAHGRLFVRNAEEMACYELTRR